MHTDSEQDHYFRLVTFVVEGCPKPLTQLFLLKSRSDPRPGVVFTDLKTFLKFHEPAIKQLKTRKIIRQAQYDLLYPSVGVFDETTWDITLVTALLQNIFTLSNIEMGYIQDIRNIRNQLYHNCVKTKVSDEEFVDKRDTLEKAVKGIGGLCSMKIKDEMEEYAKMLRNKPLTPATPLLLGKLKELYTLDEDRAELKEANDIAAAGKKIAVKNKEMLKRASVVSFSRSGVSEKRLKVLDNVLEKMKDNFKRTFTCKIPEEFEPQKEEIEDIKAQLEYHRVLVSGRDRSANLSSALWAIKELNDDFDRCAQITRADDWSKVTYVDVDLVLCVDPFGTNTYNSKRADEMATIFDEVLEKTSADPPINFVIVTSTDCLKRFRHTGDHELLRSEVIIGPSTADADSEDEWDKDNWKEIQDPILLNLLAHSRSLIHNYSNDDSTIPKLRQAHEMLVENNFVVISGPRCCGKTTMAMRLLLPEKREHDRCLVLTDPSDWRNVSIGCINIVVIEDFCGKYGYDRDLARHWLRKFDLIQALVQQGEIKVIITTNDENLHECWKESIWHDLLETSITLDTVVDNRMLIYIGPPEPVLARKPISKTARSRRKQTIDLNDSDRKMVLKTSSTATLEHQFDPKLENEKKAWICQIACCHGLICVADHENGKVKVFNFNGEYLSSASVSHPWSIANIGDDRVAVSSTEQKISLLRYCNKSLTIDETIILPPDLKSGYFDMAYYNRQLYIRHDIGNSAVIKVLELGGNVTETIEPFLNVKTFSNYVINQENGSIFITNGDKRRKASRVIAMGRTGEKIMEKDFTGINVITHYGTAIDNQGRVYVCGTGRTNVMRMSEDLQNVTEIVTQIPNTYTPHSISVSGNTLVLSCMKEKEYHFIVQVYKLQ